MGARKKKWYHTFMKRSYLLPGVIGLVIGLIVGYAVGMTLL